MVRADIKGVFRTNKKLKDGARHIYWYHRGTGKRLRGNPGSPEFIADYAAAEKLIRDRHAGTVNSLIRYYTTSVEFEQKLATSTQAEYKRMLTKAESEFGTMPQPRHLVESRIGWIVRESLMPRSTPFRIGNGSGRNRS